MNITIYSTAVCAACNELTHWLDKNDIVYQKKVTDQDPAIMEEFMQVNDGMIGVPFTIITDDQGQETKLSGFDLGRFKQILGIG
jgi:glutaredoxin